MKRSMWSALALCLLGACSTTPDKNDPAGAGKASGDAEEAGAEGLRAERRGDETVKEFDLNRDKKPDVWKYYAVVKDESGKPLERLLRKELDINFDGKVDIWRHYDDQEQQDKESLDLDFDGRIDQVNYLERGMVIKKEKDLNYDKKPDLWIFYEKNKVVRKERDTDGDTKIDYWEYWEGDSIDRIGEDLDGDGTVDKWTKRTVAAE